MSLRHAALLLLPLSILAACDRSEPEATDTKPQPILEGSVSDAMIQTDTMQAEAPLEAPVASGVPAEDDGKASPRKQPGGRAAPDAESDAEGETLPTPSPPPPETKAPAGAGTPAPSP